MCDSQKLVAGGDNNPVICFTQMKTRYKFPNTENYLVISDTHSLDLLYNLGNLQKTKRSKHFVNTENIHQ